MISAPLAHSQTRLQFTLPDHGYGANALHSAPVYDLAFAELWPGQTKVNNSQAVQP